MKLGIPDVSRDIAEFRADLKAVRDSLDQLADLKAIRDLLERLVELEEAKQ